VSKTSSSGESAESALITVKRGADAESKTIGVSALASALSAKEDAETFLLETIAPLVAIDHVPPGAAIGQLRVTRSGSIEDWEVAPEYLDGVEKRPLILRRPQSGGGTSTLTVPTRGSESLPAAVGEVLGDDIEPVVKFGVAADGDLIGEILVDFKRGNVVEWSVNDKYRNPEGDR